MVNEWMSVNRGCEQAADTAFHEFTDITRQIIINVGVLLPELRDKKLNLKFCSGYNLEKDFVPKFQI
jgi:hypothetical protein